MDRNSQLGMLIFRPCVMKVPKKALKRRISMKKPLKMILLINIFLVCICRHRGQFGGQLTKNIISKLLYLDCSFLLHDCHIFFLCTLEPTLKSYHYTWSIVTIQSRCIIGKWSEQLNKIFLKDS